AKAGTTTGFDNGAAVTGAVNTADGSKLIVGQGGASAGSLSGNGAGQFNGRLTLTDANGNGTYSGSFNGGGLTVHQGTETLTGQNHNAENTIVDRTGGLVLAKGGSLDGALENAGHSTVAGTLAGAVINSGTFDGQAGGTVGSLDNKGQANLDGTTVQGTFNNEAGSHFSVTNNATAGSLAGSGTGVLNDKSTLTLTHANPTDVYSGAMHGQGAVDVTGGLATLTGQNDYTGLTTVEKDAGLAVTSGGSITALENKGATTLDRGTVTGAVNTADGSTLTVGQGGASAGSLSGNGAGQFTGRLTLTDANGNGTYSGSFNGGGLTVHQGTETLTGQNHNAENTIVDRAGGLVLAKGGSLDGALENAGHSTVAGTLAGAVINSGTFDGQAGGTVGSLTNTGDASLNQSSVVEGDVAQNGGSFTLDKSKVNGKLAIASGTATVNSGTVAGSVDNGGSLFVKNNGAVGRLTNTGGATLNSGSVVEGDVEQNSGSFSLTGSKVNGALTVAGGEATVDHGSVGGAVTNHSTFTSHGGSVGSVTNTGAAVLDQNSVVAGDVEQNNGSLTLDGSSINGTLVANGGQIKLDNAASSARSLVGGHDVALNTGLTLTNAESRYDGGLSGAGSLTVQNGKETLTGTNTYNGSTTIGQGATLQLGNGGNTGSISNTSSINDDGTLAVDRNDTVTMGQNITGNGGFEQNGSGTTLLENNNSYKNTTSVNAGRLEVDGNQKDATGLTTVASGAALAGTGTLGGSVNVASHGVLTPGSSSNPTGLLTVNGNLTMNPGSVLQVNAIAQNSGQTIKDDAGISYNVQKGSSVDVKGTATFNNTSFQLHVTGDKQVQYGQAYVLASSDKNKINFVGDLGKAGQEIAAGAGLVSGSSFVSPVLKNISDPVLALVMERNNVSFSEAGTTKNTRAAGLGLDSLPTSNALSQTFTAMSS
ncbi:beta strand repeat-containing protein, partial [Saccharibacter floricola]